MIPASEIMDDLRAYDKGRHDFRMDDLELVLRQPRLQGYLNLMEKNKLQRGLVVVQIYLEMLKRMRDFPREKVSDYQSEGESPVKRPQDVSGGLSDIPSPPACEPAGGCEQEKEGEEGSMSQYDLLLAMMSARIPVYIYGCAGGGKSRAMEDVAKRLGYTFIRSVAFRSRSDVCGGVSAGGVVRSPLHLLVERARAEKDTVFVFCVDEFDRCDPSVAVCLNPVLSDRTLPAVDGQVDIPDNVYIVATGNSDGSGCSPDYWAPVSDRSVLDRFVMMEWKPDLSLCRTILGEHSEDSWTSDVDLTPRLCSRFSALVSAGVPVPQAVSLTWGI